MAGLRPFRFEAGEGYLYRLHPLAKLLAMACLAASAFLGHALVLPAAAILLILGLANLGFKAADLRPGAIFLGWMALATAFMRLLGFEGIRPVFQAGELPWVGLYLSRLALLWLAGEALFRCTPAAKMGEALSLLQRKLFRGARLDVGLFFGLCMDFIPRAFASWEESMDAARSRGYGGPSRPAATVDILTSFLQRSMRGAVRSSEALEARCYHPGRTLLLPPFRPADAAFCALSLIFLLASLASGGLAWGRFPS